MGESQLLPPQRRSLNFPDFPLYQTARFFIVVAIEMQSVAVGWQVYEITHRALALGMTGLVQFLPGVLLFLVAGHTADMVNRRSLLTACYAGYALCSALLLAITLHGIVRVYPVYVVLTLVGVVRS